MKGIALFLSLHLLVANLLPNRVWHELSEIFALIEHYQEHAENGDQDLSTLDFLLLHYADNSHQESAEHEKLPFHHSHPDSVVNFFCVLLPGSLFVTLEDVWIKKTVFFFQQRFSSQFFHTFWQPPKI